MAFRVTTGHQMFKAEAFYPNTPMLQYAGGSGATGVPSGIEKSLVELSHLSSSQILMY
jgi:hypothetical protein